MSQQPTSEAVEAVARALLDADPEDDGPFDRWTCHLHMSAARTAITAYLQWVDDHANNQPEHNRGDGDT